MGLFVISIRFMNREYDTIFYYNKIVAYDAVKVLACRNYHCAIKKDFKHS